MSKTRPHKSLYKDSRPGTRYRPPKSMAELMALYAGMARILAVLLVGSIPLDFLLYQSLSGVNLDDLSVLKLRLIALLLITVIVILCITRRIIGLVQSVLRLSTADKRLKYLGFLAACICSLVPLTVFLGNEEALENITGIALGVAALVVGVVQLYQLVQAMLESLKMQNTWQLKMRIGHGRFLATLIGLLFCRALPVIIVLLAQTLHYPLVQYLLTCFIVLFFGQFMILELTIPIVLDPITHREHRAMRQKAAGKVKEKRRLKKLNVRHKSTIKGRKSKDSRGKQRR